MRQVKLLVMAIAAFVMVIVGEGLVKRSITIFMCGALSITSTTCYANLLSTGQKIKELDKLLDMEFQIAKRFGQTI